MTSNNPYAYACMYNVDSYYTPGTFECYYFLLDMDLQSVMYYESIVLNEN